MAEVTGYQAEDLREVVVTLHNVHVKVSTLCTTLFVCASTLSLAVRLCLHFTHSQ